MQIWPKGQIWISCSGNTRRRLDYDGNNVVRTAADGDNGWTFIHAAGVDDPIMRPKKTS